MTRIRSTAALAGIVGVGLAATLGSGVTFATTSSPRTSPPPKLYFVSVPSKSLTSTGGNQSILALRVPAGSYLLTSTATASNEGTTSLDVNCYLTAGSSSDRGAGWAGTGGGEASLSMALAHTFKTASVAHLACSSSGEAGVTIFYATIAAQPASAIQK